MAFSLRFASIRTITQRPHKHLVRTMSTAVNSPLVQQTADFVREQLKSNDASHDWRHIERVWTLARTLAKEENVPEENLEIVDLAALLHDIDDWKYQTEDVKTKRAVQFLESQQVPSEKVARVMAIIDNMGFKEELGGNKRETSVEFGCVQDADRLDAIGAIGIARCFTYGGHKKRALYDPEFPPSEEVSQEQYMQQGRNAPTINHFYEKLFKLCGMMKTNAGKRIAEERHAFMEVFVAQFYKEISGRG
uniref:HD/PDEase domain-containing protein n=1 Tax=Globisporangium ultimum (strain ATCC 200006 / CBS 805.95 / DAOM BR144) TaxID=431595 RepID=K3X429_GLOUD